ncbi:amino acid ABC transporter substrate-binding protein [Thiocapsa roseopersicina]|nr:amino acid ABC transporter substrate-binding protein [Thiocapsa roseopersicina]
MRLDRRHWCATLMIFASVLVTQAEAGEVLDSVKSRGQLRCGVSEGIPGFSERDAEGRWRGLDVDFCRAVAAAVLDDPDKVEWVPLYASARFPALQSRKVDLLIRNTSWTLTREAVLKVQFPGILYYDGQGFLVPAAAGIETLADLAGATVCVEKGTTHRRNLETYFAAHGWSVEPLVMDSAPETAQAFFDGRCRAYTSDAAQLAAMRLLAPAQREADLILPERISKEPLSPVVWRGDPEWTTLVRWVLNALILAEEYGVNRANIDAVDAEGTNPLVRRTDDERGLIARALGVEPRWGIRAVRAVGNYGEMFERNVGRDSPLKIERGLNRLWTEGGLHYVPPLD